MDTDALIDGPKTTGSLLFSGSFINNDGGAGLDASATVTGGNTGSDDLASFNVKQVGEAASTDAKLTVAG